MPSPGPRLRTENRADRHRRLEQCHTWRLPGICVANGGLSVGLFLAHAQPDGAAS